MRMKGRLSPAAADGLRTLIAKVVADIVARLKPRFTTALTGMRDRSRRRPHASSANFDAKRTIAANLANVDPATGRMLVEQVRFAARRRRTNLQWDVIVLADQSGSMADSLLHAAVSASILAGLPGVSVRLILFDTSLVDLTHLAHDPVEVLLTAQLGGGTNIAQAMKHAESLVQPADPHGGGADQRLRRGRVGDGVDRQRSAGWRRAASRCWGWRRFLTRANPGTTPPRSPGWWPRVCRWPP